jgi:alkylation response protein AidB-like acyl-CoA dehydrogenase
MDNEELTLFRDMARRAFEQEIGPHFEQWEEEHLAPRELWNTLGEAGLLCPDMPEEYGGAGTSPHVTLALIEELSNMGYGGIATHRGTKAAVAHQDDYRGSRGCTGNDGARSRFRSSEHTHQCGERR